uniref:Uncharacterized protein n=1 Tax=Sphaerodactylus townsendi TaxID=933632 RepID=A0ACB8GCX8_9SAUR
MNFELTEHQSLPFGQLVECPGVAASARPGLGQPGGGASSKMPAGPGNSRPRRRIACGGPERPEDGRKEAERPGDSREVAEQPGDGREEAQLRSDPQLRPLKGSAGLGWGESEARHA